MIIPRLDTGSTPAPCRGGFADVYRGKYKGRTVAIKVPRLYTRNDPDLDLSVGAPLHALCTKQTLILSLAEVL